ncbi:MAG TPA: DUF4231 domain-containing protein [Blastocatellia bacterium]|nr:DUF4231 domain-containing protein [Blastocatellia bacterium]
MSANGLDKKSIRFSNRNEAVVVLPAADAEAKDVVAALGLPPYEAVIVVSGGAGGLDEKLVPRLTQLFGRGVARAAVEARAVILDGGTQAGVMAMMGEAVAGRGYKTSLVGVAPKSLINFAEGATGGVPLEPNHSHFVLVDGDTWGSETSTLFALAAALINRTAPAGAANQPPKDGAEKAAKGVMILVNGGPISRNEVLYAVRQNLSLIVVEGSGGLADEIATAWKARPALPDDPVMAEIVADGDIHLHLLSNPVNGIERLIIRELGVDKVLMQAWEVFADYDLNASLQERRFSGLQIAILIFGLVGTALAIGKQVYPTAESGVNYWVHKILYQVLILVPILLTVLITVLNRFKQGNKWLLLRAGAEAIKREIYRYRARSNPYDKEQAEQVLSQRVEDITRRTMRTEVNLSALVPYDKKLGYPPRYTACEQDDGFTYLSPDRYVDVRLGDQCSYYQRGAVRLERRLKLIYWLTFVIGGIGTYLAAIGQQLWIALTTAIVAALGTYLGYRQTENTLMKYNQAATDLANIKAWWNALPADEQAKQTNINSLVAHTEQVLQSELDGWVQQMQNALSELRKGQRGEEKGEGTEHSTSRSRSESRRDQTAAGTKPKETPTSQPVDPKAKPGGDQQAAGA